MGHQQLVKDAPVQLAEPADFQFTGVLIGSECIAQGDGLIHGH